MIQESGFVYRWHDLKANHYYIGSHWGSEDDGYVCSSKWMRDAYKKRPETFAPREILAVITTSRKDLLRREEWWLNTIHDSQLGKSVYNLKKQADNLLWQADDRKRMTASEKMSQARQIILDDPVKGPALRQAISKALSGKILSEEQRATLSRAHIGKPLSEEHRAAIGAGHRGQKREPLSEEHRAALSRAHIGKPWSLKRSCAVLKPRKKVVHSAEFCAAISARQFGVKRGPYKRKGISQRSMRRVMNVAETVAC